MMHHIQRSGWAVLAAGAMVASLLAVGASPAGGQVLGGGSVNISANQLIDHRAQTVACVAPALEDQGFADVVDTHAFKDAINCVAYYGITNGTGDGSTYSPNDDVTRAQMAVFIARAAEAAGVDLGDAMSAGFTDIGDTWSEAQDAINRLASKKIISKGGAFRPNDLITRAEMATFLIGFLAAASPTVKIGTEGNEKGRIQLGIGRTPEQQLRDEFDWFADARAAVPSAVDEAISALWELSVTRGAERIRPSSPRAPDVLVSLSSYAMISNTAFNAENNPSSDNARAVRLAGASLVTPRTLAFDKDGKATFLVTGLPDQASHQKQDKSDIDFTIQHLPAGASSGAGVPLPYNFDPGGTVNRGQMAEFITRALAHTPVRPAGVSGQYIPRPRDADEEVIRYTGATAVVASVRTADFKPVSNTVLDLFRIDTPGEELAFKRDGSCSSEVSRITPGRYECEIDVLDSITGGDGDTRPSLGTVDTGGTTVWIWTGKSKDEVDNDTKLYKVQVPYVTGRTPAQVSVSTEHIGVRVRLATDRNTPSSQLTIDTDGDNTIGNDGDTIPIAGHAYLAVGPDGSYTFGYERSGIDTSETDTLTATLEAWDHDGKSATTGLTDTGSEKIQWAASATGTDSSGKQIVAIDKENNTIFVADGTFEASTRTITDDSVLAIRYDSNDRFDIDDNGPESGDGPNHGTAGLAKFERLLSKRAGFSVSWTIRGAGVRDVNEYTLVIPNGG